MPAAKPRRLVYVNLSDLVPADRNARLHDLPTLQAKMDRFGYLDPIVIDDRTGKMIGGHGRLETLQTARAAGLDAPEGIVVGKTDWQVPTMQGWASKDDAEADAANIALNPAPDDPGYDVDVLAAILADVAKTDAGYEGTGHDAGTLEELLAAVAEFPTLPGAPDIPAVQPFAVADLKPHPRNYQEHTEEQLDHLAQAIQQHGFYKNIVLARDLTILAGHGAVLAAGTRLQMEKVPAVRLDLDPNDPQALKIIAADNEIAKRGTRDDRSLTELLREVAETDTFGLAGTGFDEMILANLLMVTRSTAEVRDVDAAAEWVGLPSYEPKQKSTQLVINFETPADRDEFIKTSFNGTVSKRTSEQSWSAHWPVREEPRESRFVQWELDPEGEA
jgi:hypothetical protein